MADKKKLPCGMTKKPYGWPGMIEAYFSFVRYCLLDKKHRDAFTKDTGHIIEALLPKTPLDKMVNDACKVNDIMLPAFFDWVTLNRWGESE